MVCFHPNRAFRSPSGSIVFSPGAGYVDRPLFLPCGQCVGCRLERSRQWAVRCMHEAQLHDENCFITLTYDPEHLPPGGTLVVADFQRFMKRLKKRFGGRSIRFIQCGEYGEQLARPHYHACLFGFDFPDKVVHSKRRGHVVWRSPILEQVWPFGLSEIGSLTFRSAAYVARYVMKKVSGDVAEAHYRFVDSDGVVFNRHPEYFTQSRRPGIGSAWFDKFRSDVYPSDFVVVDGVKSRPARYYDKKLEAVDERAVQRLKGKRKRAACSHSSDTSPDRLKVREKVLSRKLEFFLKREV